MRTSTGRVLVVAAACLVCMTGCETSTKLTGLLGSTKRRSGYHGVHRQARPIQPNPATTGSVAAAAAARAGSGSTPRRRTCSARIRYDDLNLGKKYFRSANFGLAEKHFRRAVELHPRDAEAWVGLAASYDRLKRFELADRAYAQAIAIIGETPEIMNNKGFSYMLRGDYVRARRTLDGGAGPGARQSLHPEQSRAPGKGPAPRQVGD